MSNTREVNRLEVIVDNQSNQTKRSLELTVVCIESLSAHNPVIYVSVINPSDYYIIVAEIMGNKISCCKANSPQTHRKKLDSNSYIEADLKQDRIGPNLQHISEREPEDNEADPSSHPTAGPLFMQRSRSDIRCEPTLVLPLSYHSLIGLSFDVMTGHRKSQINVSNVGIDDTQ